MMPMKPALRATMMGTSTVNEFDYWWYVQFSRFTLFPQASMKKLVSTLIKGFARVYGPFKFGRRAQWVESIWNGIVLGHSLICSLACTALNLTGSRGHGKKVFGYDKNTSNSYCFYPLCCDFKESRANLHMHLTFHNPSISPFIFAIIPVSAPFVVAFVLVAISVWCLGSWHKELGTVDYRMTRRFSYTGTVEPRCNYLKGLMNRCTSEFCYWTKETSFM